MAEATRLYQRLLDHYDPKNELYRWLLNFSYMALGRFPEGVPARYLIESDFIDAFYGRRYEETAARFDHLVFRDRARELGVDVYDAGKGVAVEDLDGDGFLDLVTGGIFSDVRFFHNDGGRRFLDWTDRVGLAGVVQPFIIAAADYDNDGWMDLFVGRPFHVFALFRNRGDGTFEETTGESGLLAAVEPGQSVFTFVSTWADVDNDGDLDLFLAQLGRRLPLARGLLGKAPMSSKLFLNDGGRFSDGTNAFGPSASGGRPGLYGRGIRGLRRRWLAGSLSVEIHSRDQRSPTQRRRAFVRGYGAHPQSRSGLHGELR